MAEFIRPEITAHVDYEFKKFMKKHGKDYSTDLEQTKRKEVFRQNIRYIHAINRQNRGNDLCNLYIITYFKSFWIDL